MPAPPSVSPELRPALRPGIVAADAGEPDTIILHDQHRISPAVLGISSLAFAIVQQFDGSRTIREHQAFLSAGGLNVPLDLLCGLAAGLDDALFLDSPALQEYLRGPVRRPACIGCYPADEAGVRAQLRKLFTAPGGPGLPNPDRTGGSSHGRLRAALLPHMDYARGGVTYAWGFKELVERTDARLFVVIATSHYSPQHRFTLTRMNFASPLGVVETDQAYIDRLVAHYGDGLFDDPYAHLPEHSIELEVVLLQYLYEHRGPIRIVPLLVGSLHDRVAGGAGPEDAADLARMVRALRRAEAEAGEPVCYLISGDLAHIGPKFGDPEPVTPDRLTDSRKRDEAILERLSAADPAGFFAVVAAEGDARRICGMPPAWLTLAAARPKHGRVLHYNQFVHPQGDESVSFAAAAFYD